VLKPGEHEAMLSISKPYFADLLTFLEGTGCRPGEVYHCEAMHFDRDLGAIVFRWDATEGYIHKTAQKTGRDRVIFLSPHLVALTQRLCDKHPTGYLFQNRDGGQWTDSSVYLMLKRLRKRLKLTSKMIPYSYRHTFATNWLKMGGSIKVLADLMGNSVAIIEHHYGHLDADRGTLRKLLCSFKANQKAKAGSLPLPSELVERIVFLVKENVKNMQVEDIANLRSVLGEFRVNAEIEKTQTQHQAATGLPSG
jgi:integrase